MGFNSAFKGLRTCGELTAVCYENYVKQKTVVGKADLFYVKADDTFNNHCVLVYAVQCMKTEASELA